MTTSTWWRCWPARTAASPACPGNGTRSAPPAWPPSSATGCAPPRPPTTPRPAVRPARRTRRPPAVAWTRPRGSRCGGRSPPLRRQRAARTSSSPASDQAGVLVRKRFSVTQPGSGHRVRGRPARRHHQGRRAGLVRRRETRSGPELAQAAAAMDPAPGHARQASGPDRRGAERDLGPRHPRRRRRHRADPHPGLDRSGCRR